VAVRGRVTRFNQRQQVGPRVSKVDGVTVSEDKRLRELETKNTAEEVAGRVIRFVISREMCVCSQHWQAPRDWNHVPTISAQPYAGDVLLTTFAEMSRPRSTGDVPTAREGMRRQRYGAAPERCRLR
jgi:hypothetical protein